MKFKSFSELKRWTRESREAKAATVFRAEYQRRVRHGGGKDERREGNRERDRKGDIQKSAEGSFESFVEYWSEHVYMETT